MKAQITKCLCPVRHVTCTYALSFLKHHTLHTILKTKYSCADCLVSFYHKYLVFHVAEYIPAYFKLDKECIDSIAVILKIYLQLKKTVYRKISFLITRNKFFLLFVYQWSLVTQIIESQLQSVPRNTLSFDIKSKKHFA